VLNQQTASVLARVKNGETVEVTERGQLIARIVPATGGELDDLIAAGRVIPATDHTPFTMPTIKAPPGSDAGQLIRQLRDEENT
jgi:antitoxin (DNA-binding transcriptional repressor) of toxin-antitoxin stability system